MSIHVALNHVTHYRYDRPITLGPQVVRLRPAPHSRTRILSYSMRVAPAGHFENWQQDPQSNYLARLVFPDKTSELRIEVDLVAEMSVLNPFDFFLEPSAENFPFEYEPVLRHELLPYLEKAPLTPAFKAYLERIPRAKKQTTNFLVEINQRLQKDIAYVIRMEPGVQTPEQTLVKGSGSCRDSGWLLVQLCRHLGLAARFVSGYLIQLKSDVKALDGPSGTEVDFTDLHAWCEVYMPGAGWIGFDPTSGLLAGEGHIPLACSPDPGSAAPVTGALEDCETTFEHHMKVSRIWEAPRVTLPYTDAQWSAIEALGHQVDRDLAQERRAADTGRRADLRLGRRPRRRRVEHRGDGADQAAAERRADGQAARASTARAACCTIGQGKWYPGEQLPRWSLNLFWRKDGEPVWKHPELFADEHRDDGVTERAGARVPEGRGQPPVARREVRVPGLRGRLVPPVARAQAAGQRRPVRRPTGGAARTRAPEQGLHAGAGQGGWPRAARGASYTGQSGSAPRWQTGSWFLRSERCYLIPGDSAMGYRLPLDSQPWATAGDLPWVHPPDPNAGVRAAAARTRSFAIRIFLVRRPKPGKAASLRRYVPAVAVRGTNGGGSPQAKPPQRFESAGWITRTAMSAEPRGGRLYVFMPPVSALEDYLELVAAVEDTAVAMKLPVILEGYEPPRDPRLAMLRVTPDPGVIEVNIHPAHSWGELVEQTTHLYQAAHETRLSTEKFMLDGRHTGTGGGNHFVLGGATPADSPFLRRPDLLTSMVGLLA